MERLRGLSWLDWVAIAMILLGAFLRLYRISETMIFQADQGRDAMVVERILDGDVVLIGPVTSVGNMYLGPFYYYFMAPFLWLTSPNPVGPAIGVALLNIFGLTLMYFWGAKRFDRLTAFLSLTLLTTNMIAIELSRFSWNPNIGPVFALLTYMATAEALLRKDYRYFVLASLAFAVLTQSHYMFLLMGGVVVFGVVYAFWVDKPRRKKIVVHSLLGLMVYAVSWLPLVVFDIKHNQIIQNGFSHYLSAQVVKLPWWEKLAITLRETEGKSFRILAQINQSPNGFVDRLVLLGTILLLLFMGIKKKIDIKNKPHVLLLFVWIVIGIVGTSFYPDTIYDHYLAFMLPGVAYFFGWLLSSGWRFGILGNLSVICILGLYLIANVSKSPALLPGGPTASSFAAHASEILADLPEGKYNLALISENKDWRGFNYRYFLSESAHPPADVEDYENLTTLVIIDELRVDDPLAYEIYEIQVPDLKVLRLVKELSGGPRIYYVTHDSPN